MDSSELLGAGLELQSPGSQHQGGSVGASAHGAWQAGKLARVLLRHALPDRGFECAPVEVVRFVKLLGVAGLLLGLTRAVVVGLDLEYDHTYGVDAFLRYDVNEVVLDLLFLFIAGGLYAQPAADQFGFAAVAACNAFMMSVLNEIPALQHSFSLYEIHCRWSFGTFAFVAFFGVVFGRVLLLHCRHLSTRPVELKRACLQLGSMFVLFWGPHLTDGDFHIHHWFYSWFLACQCNFTGVWWSRATQAWFFGGYLNGIAVYGRDPILVCEAAFYRASRGNGNCQFLAQLSTCIVPGTNHTASEPMADWWTCSGDYK